MKNIVVKILFERNACWYPNPRVPCNGFIKNICPVTVGVYCVDAKNFRENVDGSNFSKNTGAI
jgi:hypothetical protein